MKEDIRWKQRFQNYGKALMLLEEAVDANRAADRELIKAGIIQYFEFTHELAWKVMKDFLESQGYTVQHLEKKFIPFSLKSRLPKSYWLTKIYLMLPFRIFAKQMMVLAQLEGNK
jgi:hypothetical protein